MNNTKPTHHLALFPRYRGVLIKFLLSTGGCLSLNALFWDEPDIQDCEIWLQETRDIVLLYDANMLRYLQSLGRDSQCDKETDVQTPS